MRLLRKPLLGGTAMLLFGALALFGFTFGLLQVFGNPEPIKKALERSGIYQTVVENALTQTQEEQGAAAIGSIPLDRPEIQNVIKTAASPELLQAKTENALDAVYAWLRGETPELAFSLELGDVRANLANGIEQYAVQYASSLPACAPGASVDPNNLFNATCLPEGADPAQLAAQAKNNFLQSEALKETTLDANTIKTDDGRTLAQSIRAMPNVYRSATWGVSGFGLLALLLTGATILLSSSWRSGLKKVLIVFIAVGALGMIVSQLSSIGMDRVAEAAKTPLKQSAASVAEILLNNLRNWWLWYSIALIAIGIAALAALYFTKPGQEVGKDKEDAIAPGQGQTNGTPAPPAATPTFGEPQPQPADKPPKPPKRLVQ
jgi:hypothetical protein